MSNQTIHTYEFKLKCAFALKSRLANSLLPLKLITSFGIFYEKRIIHLKIQHLKNCFVSTKTDVNECQQQNKCGSGATCVNTIGSYKCQCDDGLVYDEGRCVKDSKSILIYLNISML